MSPLTLTCTTALAAGTTNMLPWTGPTTRAAAALQTSTSDLFVPLIPALVAGMVVVFVCAVRLGRLERARLASDGGRDRPRPSRQSPGAWDLSGTSILR